MKDIRIALFKGSGLISKAIQWQTRSEYSHVGIVVIDTNNALKPILYEAYHVGGVRSDRNIYKIIANGEKINLFKLETPIIEKRVENIENFLKSKVGNKYDFVSVMRFVSRRKAKDNDNYFCSELVVDALRAGEVNILNGDSSRFSPRDVSISPRIVPVEGSSFFGL